MWRSCCTGSQREAALLLGQFASADSECKVQIVQRGALRPLIEMLQSSVVQLKEMSVFALGRLAQESHNQAGIVFNGGLVPLLKLLDSKNGSVQHNAAFALFGIAENEDNVADFVKLGGVQRLQDGEFVVQATHATFHSKYIEKIAGKNQWASIDAFVIFDESWREGCPKMCSTGSCSPLPTC